MFSRGNVKEKARLLEFHSSSSMPETRRVSKNMLLNQMALDLYAGIGYFAFSYAKAGFGKVIGWELNPWSVEGLRRAAFTNKWTVKVVKPNEEYSWGDEDIVLFMENNQKALTRMKREHGLGIATVTHINCGLLPTSEATWRLALQLLSESGWVHLHENIGVKDVESRSRAIEEMFREWMESTNDARQATIEHIEYVKSFAPGVWHCVFDVYIA